MERMTKQHLETRVQNLNLRMASRGSLYRYAVQGRNGYTALDRMAVGAVDLPSAWKMSGHVISGTKREVADYLHLMMVALDDAEVQS